MAKRTVFLLVLWILGVAVGYGQTGTIERFCDNGGNNALTSGLPSSNFLQGNIPYCTVSVYFHDSTTLAPIFAAESSTGTLKSVQVTNGGSYSVCPTGVTFTGGGGSGATGSVSCTSGAVISVAVTSPGSGYTTAPTVAFTGGTGSGATAVATIVGDLTNPFQANSDGGWLVWAAVGTGYDITMSGGYPPNQYAQPRTITNIFPNAYGGTAYTIIQANGIASAPTSPVNFIDSPTVHFSITANQIQAAIVAGSLLAIEKNGVLTTDQSLLNFCDNGSCGSSLPAGMQQVYEGFDTTGGVNFWTQQAVAGANLVQQQLPGLPTNNYVLLYPQTISFNANCGFNTKCTGAVGQAAYMEIDRSGADFGGLRPRITESVTSLPAGVSDATVTEVDQCYTVFATFSAGVIFPVNGNAAPFSQTTSCTVVHTGPGYDYSSASWYLESQCTINCPGGGNPSGYSYSQPYMIVKLNTTPPVVNYINFEYPLTVNGNTISLQNAWPMLWDTGSVANAYVASTYGVVNLQQGQQINLNPLHTNTGASTFAFNGAGAVAIVKAGGAALAAGDLVSGRTAILTYSADGTWLLTNPQTASGGGTTTNALTANSSGGAAPGSTFNGSVAVVFDYHSFGAGGLAALNNWTQNQTFNGGFDATAAAQVKMPVTAGYTSAANGEIGYDSTNSNWHVWNGADSVLVPLAGGFVSGDCGEPTLTAGKWTFVDTGSPCGTGSGGLPSGVNGQIPVNNGSGATSYTAQSPTISVANGGAAITGAYTLLCDSATVATGIQDRGKIAILGAGGLPTIPDQGGTGCSGMYGMLMNSTSGAITVSRQTTNTFNVYGPTQGAPSTAQTSFSLPAGSWATFEPNVISATAYDVRIGTPPAGGAGANATYLTADGTGSPPPNYQVVTAGSGIQVTPNAGTHTFTISTASGLQGVDVLSDQRNSGTVGPPQNLEYVSVTGGSTVTLVNIASGPGVIERLWMAFSINSGDATRALNNSIITITPNNGLAPSVRMPVSAYFYSVYSGESGTFARYTSYYNSGNSNCTNTNDVCSAAPSIISVRSYIPIPFWNGVTITLTLDSTATGTLWSEPEFDNAADNFPFTGKLWAQFICPTSVAYPTQTICPTPTSTATPYYAQEQLADFYGPNPGRFFGEYLLSDDTPGGAQGTAYATLEGNYRLYLDNATATWTSATTFPSGATIMDPNGNQETWGGGTTGPVKPTFACSNTGVTTADGSGTWTETAGSPTGSWRASQPYSLACMSVLDTNGNIETVSTTGTSGASAPAWPATNCTNGTSTTDGTVTWKCSSAATYVRTAMESTGTEDWYGMGGYFSGYETPPFDFGYEGTTLKVAAAGTIGAYRYFLRQPVRFQHSVDLYRGNGDSSQRAFGTGTTSSLQTTMWYTQDAYAPSFSLDSGTYLGTQSVTLTTPANPGATICYTTDGSTPTASGGTCSHGTTYTGAISVTSSEEIIALTSQVGFSTPNLSQKRYTITSVPVQMGGKSNSVGAGTSVATSYTPRQIGDLVLVVCSNGNGGQTGFSVGGGATLDFTAHGVSGTRPDVWVGHLVVSSLTTLSLTCGQTASGQVQNSVVEFNAGTGSLAGTAISGGGSSATTVTSSAFSTTSRSIALMSVGTTGGSPATAGTIAGVSATLLQGTIFNQFSEFAPLTTSVTSQTASESWATSANYTYAVVTYAY